jgi:transketolase
MLYKSISEELVAKLTWKAQKLRLDTFEMIYRRGNGHWGGSSSVTEILTSLYFAFLNVKSNDPDWEERDRLILSKGHAAPVLYQILSEKGYFPKEILSGFRSFGSILQGHPCMNKTPGVDMSTGALGHGVSVAVGMALASQIKGIKNRTVVIIGEGDLNEGETWEGFMSAAKFRPPGLIILIDYNKVQLDGPEKKIMPIEPLELKLKSFNLNLCPLKCDGHNINDILNSFEWISKQSEWPVTVVYNTIKGKGISFTENNHKWHGAPIDDESFRKGNVELIVKLKAITDGSI